MAKYGMNAGQKVEKAMRERKKGTLKSGRSGRTREYTMVMMDVRHK